MFNPSLFALVLIPLSLKSGHTAFYNRTVMFTSKTFYFTLKSQEIFWQLSPVFPAACHIRSLALLVKAKWWMHAVNVAKIYTLPFFP